MRTIKISKNMKALKKIWRVNSVVILFCFFLPFAPPMCSSEEVNDSESNNEDVFVMDPTLTNSLNPIEIDSAQHKEIEEHKENNETVDKDEDNPFEIILKPDGKNLSGIGYILTYSFLGIILASSLISFVIAILVLFLKNWNLKRNLLTIGLSTLIIFGMYTNEQLLYGYILSLIFYLSSTLIIWVICKKIDLVFKKE
jgi:hypothetical protein